MTIHDSKHLRNAADFYPTLDAPDVVRALLEQFELPPGTVWEPSAGAGHLVKELLRAGKAVIATDLHAYPPVAGLDVRILSGLDFLERNEVPTGVQTILMNPPYGRAKGGTPAPIDQHVKQALKLMRPAGGVVVVLARADWTYAKSRRVFVQDPGFAMKIELGWRLRWVEGTDGNGKHNYAIHVWDFRKGAVWQGPVLRHGHRHKTAREDAGAATRPSGGTDTPAAWHVPPEMPCGGPRSAKAKETAR